MLDFARVVALTTGLAGATRRMHDHSHRMMPAALARLNLPPMPADRVMALLFAAGSLCFFVGPFPGYVDLVGPQAAAATFFAGSILFTAGGAVQSWLAFPERRRDRAAWRTAIVQSAGTLFFNVTTYQALHTALASPEYDRLVWRPDAFGSVCFLVSGTIAFVAAGRRGWSPTVNLLGCVFFGLSAVAGYVVPATGSELDLAAANWNTAAGAACFFACAAGGVAHGGHMEDCAGGRRRRSRAGGG